MGRRPLRHVPFGITNTGQHAALSDRAARIHLELWLIADWSNQVPRSAASIASMIGSRFKPHIIEAQIQRLIADNLVWDLGTVLQLRHPDDVRMKPDERPSAEAPPSPQQVPAESPPSPRQGPDESPMSPQQVPNRSPASPSAFNDSEGMGEDIGTWVKDRVRDRDRVKGEGEDARAREGAHPPEARPPDPPLAPRSRPDLPPELPPPPRPPQVSAPVWSAYSDLHGVARRAGHPVGWTMGEDDSLAAVAVQLGELAEPVLLRAIEDLGTKLAGGAVDGNVTNLARVLPGYVNHARTAVRREKQHEQAGATRSHRGRADANATNDYRDGGAHARPLDETLDELFGT